MTSRVSAGAVLFFALLTAALVAGVLVVRAHPDLVLEVTSQPSLIVDDDARITFFVRESDDHARLRSSTAPRTSSARWIPTSS